MTWPTKAAAAEGAVAEGAAAAEGALGTVAVLRRYPVKSMLGEDVRAMEVLGEARGWERTSDHAPVKVELAL